MTSFSVLIVRHSEQRDLADPNRETVWEALHSLPRSLLDRYQPHSHNLHGRSAPEIDSLIAKLNYLTSLITENRARAIEHYPPVSTAFVTFSDPRDARRACRYLSSHPDNPINCVVQMAPSFGDLDWTRIMKSTFKAEVSVQIDGKTSINYTLKVHQRLGCQRRSLVCLKRCNQ